MEQLELRFPEAPPTPTAQEVFDRVATHLLKQGGCATDGESCMYRSGNGKTCAVGCLIPDNLYDYAIEGSVVAGPDTGDHLLLILKALGLHPHLDLLKELQNLHDSGHVESWPIQLANLAQKNGLSPAVVEHRLGNV